MKEKEELAWGVVEVYCRQCQEESLIDALYGEPVQCNRCKGKDVQLVARG